MNVSFARILFCLVVPSISYGEFLFPTLAGRQLLQGSTRFELRGFAYAPTPIGEDPSDGSIPTTYHNPALIERDGPFLKNAGANTIRIYGAIGVATNGVASLGTNLAYIQAAARQGLWVIMGTFIHPDTDFSDPELKQKIVTAHVALVRRFKNEPNILMWAPGNEVNISQTSSTELDAWYVLLDEIAVEMKQAQGGGSGPGFGPYVCGINGATTNGVAPGIGVATNVDVWAVNIFSGPTFGVAFRDIEEQTDKPFWIAELGTDSFDNEAGEEDQKSQALYIEALWDQIQAHCDVVFGADLAFYSDEWWKGDVLGACTNDPTLNCTASTHDTGGTSFGDGPDGFINEEWLGVTGVSPSPVGGIDTVTPKEGYFTVQRLWSKPPSPCLVERAPVPFEARFDALDLQGRSSNNYGGIHFGSYGNNNIPVLSVSDVGGASGARGDKAFHVQAIDSGSGPFTFFVLVFTLAPRVDLSPGVDLSAMDTLRFDARLGQASAHNRWSIRLEDTDRQTTPTDEERNLLLPLPSLTPAFQEITFELSDFLDENDPVDLTRLVQVVLVADFPSHPFGPFTFDLIIDNLTVFSSLQGAFEAYNDLSWAEGQRSENITLFTTANTIATSPMGSRGHLVDFRTGKPIPPVLDVAGGFWNGANHASKGGISQPGTPGQEQFEGKVDATGILSYDDSNIVLTFSNLDPDLRYNLTLFGNRGVKKYTDRVTKATIMSVGSFRNSSSVGAEFLGPRDESVRIVHGYNTEHGFLGKFSYIDAGMDGSFSVTLSDGGSARPPKPYVNAVCLEGFRRRSDYLTKIGLSNDPHGEQDVTEFLSDETLYITVGDVDLDPSLTSEAEVQVNLSQAAITLTLTLTFNKASQSFVGQIDLSPFAAGRVEILVSGRAGATEILRRESAVFISP